MPLDLSKHREELHRIFAKHGVILAYLFGSQAEGKAGPLSDVDIAVLLGPQVPKERWTAVQIDLINDLIGLFHRNDVDVALLNRATPVLAQEVVRSGQVIYEAEPGARVDFQVATLRRYADTAPLRRLRNCHLLERVEYYR